MFPSLQSLLTVTVPLFLTLSSCAPITNLTANSFDDLITLQLDKAFNINQAYKLAWVEGWAGKASGHDIRDYDRGIHIILDDEVVGRFATSLLTPGTDKWWPFGWTAQCDIKKDYGMQWWDWHNRGSTLEQALDKVRQLNITEKIDGVTIQHFKNASLPAALTAQPVYTFFQETGKGWDTRWLAVLGVHDLAVIPFDSLSSTPTLQQIRPASNSTQHGSPQFSGRPTLPDSVNLITKNKS